jgi:glyoxylase-like metal-dependent hydrolase (beta-lactamase superfamily II)/rhodanese-related sulfurtransferase
MNTISVETLRTWLEEGRAVSIVDVRPKTERQEWAIPGSLHLDAYEALKAHDPEALVSLALPTDRPVVTVCAAGKTSQIAASQLCARGLQALSLEGGMKAWSLAWNTAEVSVPDGMAGVLQIRRTGKGCLSYLIGAGDQAMVIDASLDPDVYLQLAKTRGWRITHVLDTHIHADHLSRARRLAQASGAHLLLPHQERVQFPFSALRDGDTLSLGPVSLTALHTPGHTLESTCYLLNHALLFTGDTLFPSGVGRPDLEANAQETRARTTALYHSLHQLLSLPPETIVLPGHSSTPIAFDGVPVLTTMAEVQAQRSVLQQTQEEFIQSLLARIPPTPPNYRHIVRLNELGQSPERDVTELEAGANRCAIQ